MKEEYVSVSRKGAVSLLVILAVVVAGAFVLKQEGGLFAAGFEPVFCNLYEFQSCGLQRQGSAAGFVNVGLFGSNRQNFVCQSDKCVITNWISGCKTFLRVNEGQFFDFANQFEMRSNDTLSTNSCRGDFSYDIYNRRLVWCGSAACDAAVTGVSVIGSDKCTFVTNDAIYNQQGALTRGPTPSEQSYTVPEGNAYLVVRNERFICGQKAAECSIDSDCATGHTFIYTDAQGNKFGAEASAGSLQLYGCVKTPAPTQDQFNIFPQESQSNNQFNYGARCTTIKTQTVSCIPGSATCGSNAVCDVNTFTCKSSGEVSCSQDRDCGVGEVYDQQTKSFYQFVCRNPGTILSRCDRQFLRQVECRSSTECPANWYCDSDFRCKESTQPKQQAPGLCSVGDPRYFDKPPPPGNVCCPGGQKIAPTLAQCEQTSECSLLDLGCQFGKLFKGLGDIFKGLGEFILIVLLIIFGIVVVPKVLDRK